MAAALRLTCGSCGVTKAAKFLMAVPDVGVRCTSRHACKRSRGATHPPSNDFKTRGRFYVEQTADDDSAWVVVDSLHGACVGFETKTRAKQEATFCRAYVSKWGDISLHSYPYSLDDPFTDEHRLLNQSEGGQ